MPMSDQQSMPEDFKIDSNNEFPLNFNSFTCTQDNGSSNCNILSTSVEPLLYSCNNCDSLKKKLEKSREWIKFLSQKLINTDKIIHILAEYEREKQRYIELQLAYDQRSREWDQQQEQLISLLQEIQPLRDSLKAKGEVVKRERELRENSEYLNKSLHVEIEQYKANFEQLSSKVSPNLISSLEKRINCARNEVKRLRSDIEFKSCKISDLKSYISERNLYYERIAKKALWALRLSKHYGDIILNFENYFFDKNENEQCKWNRLSQNLKDAESLLKNQYKSFRENEERNLQGKIVEISILPSYAVWLDNFDYDPPAEQSFIDYKHTEVIQETTDVNDALTEAAQKLEELLSNDGEEILPKLAERTENGKTRKFANAVDVQEEQEKGQSKNKDIIMSCSGSVGGFSKEDSSDKEFHNENNLDFVERHKSQSVDDSLGICSPVSTNIVASPSKALNGFSKLGHTHVDISQKSGSKRVVGSVEKILISECNENGKHLLRVPEQNNTQKRKKLTYFADSSEDEGKVGNFGIKKSCSTDVRFSKDKKLCNEINLNFLSENDKRGSESVEICLKNQPSVNTNVYSPSNSRLHAINEAECAIIDSSLKYEAEKTAQKSEKRLFVECSRKNSNISDVTDRIEYIQNKKHLACSLNNKNQQPDELIISPCNDIFKVDDTNTRLNNENHSNLKAECKVPSSLLKNVESPSSPNILTTNRANILPSDNTAFITSKNLYNSVEENYKQPKKLRKCSVMPNVNKAYRSADDVSCSKFEDFPTVGNCKNENSNLKNNNLFDTSVFDSNSSSKKFGTQCNSLLNKSVDNFLNECYGSESGLDDIKDDHVDVNAKITTVANENNSIHFSVTNLDLSENSSSESEDTLEEKLNKIINEMRVSSPILGLDSLNLNNIHSDIDAKKMTPKFIEPDLHCNHSEEKVVIRRSKRLLTKKNTENESSSDSFLFSPGNKQNLLCRAKIPAEKQNAMYSSDSSFFSPIDDKKSKVKKTKRVSKKRKLIYSSDSETEETILKNRSFKPNGVVFDSDETVEDNVKAHVELTDCSFSPEDLCKKPYVDLSQSFSNAEAMKNLIDQCIEGEDVNLSANKVNKINKNLNRIYLNEENGIHATSLTNKKSISSLVKSKSNIAMLHVTNNDINFKNELQCDLYNSSKSSENLVNINDKCNMVQINNISSQISKMHDLCSTSDNAHSASSLGSIPCTGDIIEGNSKSSVLNLKKDALNQDNEVQIGLYLSQKNSNFSTSLNISCVESQIKTLSSCDKMSVDFNKVTEGCLLQSNFCSSKQTDLNTMNHSLQDKDCGGYKICNENQNNCSTSTEALELNEESVNSILASEELDKPILDHDNAIMSGSSLNASFSEKCISANESSYRENILSNWALVQKNERTVIGDQLNNSTSSNFSYYKNRAEKRALLKSNFTEKNKEYEKVQLEKEITSSDAEYSDLHIIENESSSDFSYSEDYKSDKGYEKDSFVVSAQERPLTRSTNNAYLKLPIENNLEVDAVASQTVSQMTHEFKDAETTLVNDLFSNIYKEIDKVSSERSHENLCSSSKFEEATSIFNEKAENNITTKSELNDFAGFTSTDSDIPGKYLDTADMKFNLAKDVSLVCSNSECHSEVAMDYESEPSTLSDFFEGLNILESSVCSGFSYGDCLLKLKNCRLNTRIWISVIKTIERQLLSNLQRETKYFFRSFIKILLTSSAVDEREFQWGLSTSHYKLFQVIKVLEHNIGAKQFPGDEILRALIHCLICKSKYVIRVHSLSSLASIFVASSSLSGSGKKEDWKQARSFLIDLLFYHVGTVHLALWSVLKTSSRIFNKQKKKACSFNQVIKWIVHYGIWIGTESVRTDLIQLLSKNKNFQFNPPENPTNIVGSIIKSMQGNFSNDDHKAMDLVSVSILSKWLGKKWIKEQLIPTSLKSFSNPNLDFNVGFSPKCNLQLFMDLINCITRFTEIDEADLNYLEGIAKKNEQNTRLNNLANEALILLREKIVNR